MSAALETAARDADPLPAARAAAASGDLALLRRLELRGLDADLDLVTRVDLANCLRDVGLVEPAERVLSGLIETAPQSPLAYFELAVIRRHQARHAEAACVLQDGVQACGGDFRLGLMLGHMLHAAGAHEPADAALASLRPASLHEASQIEIIAEFGDYLRQHPRGGALFLLDDLKRRHGHLEQADVTARIAQALSARRPFALIRLGDGEGAWLRMARAEEHAHRHLYAANRAEFLSIWFGDDFDARACAFHTQADALLALLPQADIVGIPYGSWLHHEYGIASPRGVPSLVNLCRSLRAAPHADLPTFCSQNVHRDLHLSGALASLLRAERRIGLVSCHPELPDALARHFGFEEVEFHHLPGEHGRAEFITGAIELGAHYPDRFQAVMNALSRPHDGRLFLVAGGILGKFYALAIRRHGGIAIDIGSLADAWLQRATRPDYCDALSLSSRSLAAAG